MEWIKCSERAPEINVGGYISDPVLVRYIDASGKIKYRVDTYIKDLCHKDESYRWNNKKLRKGFAEDYVAWMPIPEYKEGE